MIVGNIGLARGFGAALCMACMSAFGVAAALKHMRMVDEVNKALPEGVKPFRPIGWGNNWEAHRVVAEYKRLYPNGPLARHTMILEECAFTALSFACAFLGFGLLSVGPIVFIGFMHWFQRTGLLAPVTSDKAASGGPGERVGQGKP